MPPSRPINDRDTKKARVLANRYEIDKKLGSGNFGTAFLCRDVKCNNQLKVLKEIPVDLKPDETVDANQEAKLLSKLEHPGIVKFYDSFIDGDFFCIVTEYCEGGDLALKIEEYKKERKSFSEETILDWSIQLLLAADYIHSRRVLHRDLKTRNIFIKDNLMKIGDFGISRILMGTADMASTFTGTPYYMSPEVLKHEGYNSQSDIWSIGCIIYELCTLEHAFHGQGIMTIMNKIVDDEPPALPSRFSEDLCDVFKKMLIKDPLKRPTAAEVLKFHFIRKHIAKMRISLADEFKAKHNTSPEIVNREASEIASLMREKSHLRDFQSPLQNSYQQSVTQTRGQDQKPPDQKLTAREKMRLKKMLEADAKALVLKNITKIQLVDNAERRQKNKTSLEKTNFPGWKSNNEGAEVKPAQAVRIEDVLHVRGAAAAPSWRNDPGDSDDDTITGFRSAVRRNSERGFGEGHRTTGSERLTRSMSQKTSRPVTERAPRLNATIEGTYTDDRPIAPMRDTMVYSREYSSLDFKDGIPDTPDQANMFYDQFSDFDHDVFDNEDTVKDNQEELINCLEMQLGKEDIEEVTIVNDDTIRGAFGPNARETKIKNIQAECVKVLGQDVFEKAYSYLRTSRSAPRGKQKSEKEIMNGLREYVKNPSDCFLLDQLLFLEEQAKFN